MPGVRGHIYSLHSWPSSSPWVQSRWKSQACPSWRTVPFQQVKELCKAILEPGDVPGKHRETHAPGQFRWLRGKALGQHHSAVPFTSQGLTGMPDLATCRANTRRPRGRKSPNTPPPRPLGSGEWSSLLVMVSSRVGLGLVHISPALWGPQPWLQCARWRAYNLICTQTAVSARSGLGHIWSSVSPTRS